MDPRSIGGFPMFRHLLLPRYDRYVVSTYLKMALVCFCGMLFLVVVIDAMENIDKYIHYAEQNEIPFGKMSWEMVKHYAAYAPSLFFQFMTSGLIVMAGMFVILQLGLSNEFTILRASGVSLKRAVLPIVIVALLLGLGVSLTRDYYMPGFLRTSYVMANNIRPDVATPISILIEDGDDRHFVHIGFFKSDEGIAYNIRIEVRTDEDLINWTNRFRVYEARAATLDPRVVPDAPHDDRPNQWKPLGEGWVVESGPYYQSPVQAWSNPLPTYITHAMLERQTLGNKVLTWGDLQRRKGELDMQLEIAERLSDPYSGAMILLVVFGITLRSIVRGNQVNYVQDALIALGAFALFHLLRMILQSQALADPETFPPLLVSHGPAILYLAVGSFLLLRLE